MTLLPVLIFAVLASGVVAGITEETGPSCLPDPRVIWQLPADDPKLLELLTKHGLECRSLGKYREAENLLERVVLQLGHANGNATAELAGPLSNLAAVYRDLGRRSEARPMLQRALALAERSDARTRAFIENNLALLYWDLGDLTRAEPLLRRAAARLTGAEHLDALANLGALYRETGRLPQAETIMRQILEHDDTSWQAWRNLAAIYRLRRDFSRAESALSHARTRAERASERAETFFEEALLRAAQADWPRAEASIEEGIAIEEGIFGVESVNLVPYVEVQARVLRQLRQHAKSKEASLRARLLRAAM